LAGLSSKGRNSAERVRCRGMCMIAEGLGGTRGGERLEGARLRARGGGEEPTQEVDGFWEGLAAEMGGEEKIKCRYSLVVKVLCSRGLKI